MAKASAKPTAAKSGKGASKARSGKSKARVTPPSDVSEGFAFGALESEAYSRASATPSHSIFDSNDLKTESKTAKVPRPKRQGATAKNYAAASDADPSTSEGYVDEARRAFKTAKVTLNDVVESIPWDDWRARVGAGLGSTLVHAGKWLAERGFELTRQADGVRTESGSKAATSAFAEQNQDAHRDEQRT